MNADNNALTDAQIEAQIEARLNERFDVLARLTTAVTDGIARALIVSGPAGLGKSWTVERTLADWDPLATFYSITKGYVRATGLIKLLHQFRHSGMVLVFDDADTILFDDTSMNLLKAVCDTTERRVVSYLSEIELVDDNGDVVPRSFVFDGGIIFITNLNFDHLIAAGNKMAPHLDALISRSHYIDLAMRTKRDYLVRIKQVMRAGMLSGFAMSQEEEAEVFAFVKAHQDHLRQLNLRTVLKVAAIRKTNRGGNDWVKTARITCCRGA